MEHKYTAIEWPSALSRRFFAAKMGISMVGLERLLEGNESWRTRERMNQLVDLIIEHVGETTLLDRFDAVCDVFDDEWAHGEIAAGRVEYWKRVHAQKGGGDVRLNTAAGLVVARICSIKNAD